MLNLVEGIYLGEAKEAEGFTGLRITKKLRIGGGAIPEANNFITQSGDTIVTSTGTPLALDGINSLTTAPSITDTQLTFADDGNSTVSFSMQQLKDYVNPAPAKQGRFVSLNYTNQGAYSDDGIDWTSLTVSSSNRRWSWIAFGNGIYVATTDNSQYYAYSTDGINWTEVSSDFSLRSVTFGNNIFVMTTVGKTRYSTDGINWTQGTISSSGKEVKFVNDRFILWDNSHWNASTIYYSLDGINWTTLSSALPSVERIIWHDVCFGNNKYIFIGGIQGTDSTNAYAYSSDGLSWSQGTLPVSRGWYSCAFGNNKFILYPYSSTTTCVSSDGINWTSITLPSSGSGGQIIYENNMFVIVQRSSNTMMYSTNGDTWLTSTMPSSQYWGCVAYGEV